MLCIFALVTTHSTTVSRACEASYTSYFRAQDIYGNTSDITSVTYSVEAPPPPPAPTVIDGIIFGACSSCDVTGTSEETTLSTYNTAAQSTNYSTSDHVSTYTKPNSTVQTLSLFKFDLTSIPTSATVVNAALYAYVYASGGDASQYVTAHKITGDNPTISQATWLSSATGETWTTAGAIDDAAAYETYEAVAASGWVEFVIPLMVADWVTTPANNKGLILAPEQYSSHNLADTYRFYYSSEATDTALRPFLVVNYTTTGNKTVALSGGDKSVALSGGDKTISW